MSPLGHVLRDLGGQPGRDHLSGGCRCRLLLLLRLLHDVGGALPSQRRPRMSMNCMAGRRIVE
eukprot:13173131-Heterocapsa_arctica.AAC.1